MENKLTSGIHFLEEGENSKSQTRREFLQNSAKGITVIAGGSLLVSLLNSCSDDDNPTGPSAPLPGEGTTIRVNTLTALFGVLKNVGAVIAVDEGVISGLPRHGVFIIRNSETQATVLSRVCTHQGCQVGDFNGGTATCPCHGSQYNLSGGVTRGPAPASLTRFNSSINGEIIEFEV